MTAYLLGIIACLGLLAGCGGLHGSFQPVDSYGSGAPVEREELVGDDLSTKHLEELYAKSGLSGRDPSLEAELQQWDHQVKFDVPIQMNRQVKAYLVYFSTERKAIVQRQLARSTQYLPMIKAVFQEYGLPEDSGLPGHGGKRLQPQCPVPCRRLRHVAVHQGHRATLRISHRRLR